MADLLKIGCRVQVPKKNVKGTVEYIGNTSFSQGKWVGINLDEPKGKNNGTVEEKVYFKCEENHGMFVRQSQLIILDENDSPVIDLTEDGGSTPKTPRPGATRLSSAARRKSSPVSAHPPSKRPEKSSSRLSLASVTSSHSKEDLSGSTTSLSTPQMTTVTKRTSSFVEKTPKVKHIPTLQSKSSAKPPATSRRSVTGERTIKSRSQSKDDISGSQTGFVETLKPQFTPGQVVQSPNPVLSGSTTGINMLGGSNNVSLLQQELENLREQLKDVQEKYDTLLVKRRQDKEKLKELEQLRMHVDQLSEFKERILESKAALHRELQQARKEAQEAVETRDAHAEEMACLSDTVEMATLDKEMAEEKAESLQMELQEAKDKLEEVTVDYETLKAELEASASGGQPRPAVSYEFKQMEQQNARLQETLLKLRDVIAQDRHDYQKLLKDVEQKKSEIAELSRTKEKLSTRVEQLEEQVVDLQEQVDAAIGAETMASTLTYDKMMLQEEVEKLREEINDLEAIESANDQLLEEHKEMELELNERLDMTFARLREAVREKEAAVENLADREQTIHKYREVVTALQEERQDLLSRLEQALNKPITLPETMDYNKVFSETIAHKRAIDLELRQIELKQMEQHVQFLIAFMPDGFMGRGGDHDAIRMLLLHTRVLWKCEILLSHIREKFLPVDKIHRTAVVKEDVVVRFSTGARLSFFLHFLQMVVHQFLHGLDTCTPETLLAAGTRFPELQAQERVLDTYLVSVKEDRLDENVLSEPLDKCGQVMEALRLGAFPKSGTHASHLVRDACASLSSACESACTDALALQALADIAAGNNEVVLLTQYMALNLDVCGQQLKNIRRRIPVKEPNLNIPVNCVDDLSACVLSMGRLVRTFAELHKQARQTVLLLGEGDNAYPIEQLEDAFNSAADRNLDSDDPGVDAVKATVNALTAVVGKLNDLVENSEYDLVIPTETVVERPIVSRATTFKREMEQVKVLAKKLEDRELDLKEMKLNLKVKSDELSEMTIRKDLLEKKLSNMSRDSEDEFIKMKQELKVVKAELETKTKEFERTLDHLQADIEALEAEKKDLKERLRVSAKKPMSDITNKSEVLADKATSPTGVVYSVGSEGGVPAGEFRRLRAKLQEERLERFKLECKISAQKMEGLLDKIPGLKVDSKDRKETEMKVDSLMAEGAKLQKDVINSLMPKCIDLSKLKPGEKCDFSQYVYTQNLKEKELMNKIESYKSDVSRCVAQSRKGGYIKTSMEIFPTPEMNAALQECDPVTIGTIQIAVPATHKDAGKTIPLFVNDNSLSSLLRAISIPSY